MTSAGSATSLRVGAVDDDVGPLGDVAPGVAVDDKAHSQSADGVRALSSRWLLLYFALFIALAVFAAATRGMWLDETWSIFESQHDVPLNIAFADRWLRDVSPPFFYFLAWLGEPLAGRDIVACRLMNLVPLALAATGFGHLARRDPDRRPFLILFGVLLLAQPATMAFFAEYRGYFWMLAGAAVLAASLCVIGMRDGDYTRHDRSRLLLVLASASVVFTLHYIAALEVGIMFACFVGRLWFEGRRRWALRLLAVGTVAGLPIALSFILQHAVLTRFGRVGWIRTSPGDALTTIFNLAATSAAVCIVAIAALILRRTSVPWRTSSMLRVTVGTCWGAVGASLVLLIIGNAFQPFIVPRYLVPMIPFAIAPLALLAGPAIERDRFLAGATVLFAAMWLGSVAHTLNHDGRWDDSARSIARVHAACPGTAVHSPPHWQFSRLGLVQGPHEFEALRLGLTIEARRFGFPLEPAGSRRVAGACPTLVWIENWAEKPPAVADVVGKLGLPLGRAQVLAARVEQEGEGLLISFPAPARPPAPTGTSAARGAEHG